MQELLPCSLLYVVWKSSGSNLMLTLRVLLILYGCNKILWFNAIIGKGSRPLWRLQLTKFITPAVIDPDAQPANWHCMSMRISLHIDMVSPWYVCEGDFAGSRGNMFLSTLASFNFETHSFVVVIHTEMGNDSCSQFHSPLRLQRTWCFQHFMYS